MNFQRRLLLFFFFLFWKGNNKFLWMFITLVELSPIVLRTVAHILTWIIETLGDVLSLLIFLIGMLLG